MIALIPARSGSRGVPDKNIKKLGGRPLLVYSIETAIECGLDVYVSTDSVPYAHVARSNGAMEIMRDPKAATDTATDLDVVKDFLELVDAGIIVYLRPTTPLRDANVVRKAIERFQCDENATALRSVHEMSESAYKCAEVWPDGYLARIGSRPPISEWRDMDFANFPRQDYMETYVCNGYVDIFRVSHIKETGSLLGNRVIAYETEVASEIDTLDDFRYLEWLVGRKSGNGS